MKSVWTHHPRPIVKLFNKFRFFLSRLPLISMQLPLLIIVQVLSNSGFMTLYVWDNYTVIGTNQCLHQSVWYKSPQKNSEVIEYKSACLLLNAQNVELWKFAPIFLIYPWHLSANNDTCSLFTSPMIVFQPNKKCSQGLKIHFYKK